MALQLVRSFNSSDYPQKIERFYAEPDSPRERNAFKTAAQSQAHIAGLTDYHIDETSAFCRIHLRNEEDLIRFKAASAFDSEMDVDLVTASPKVTNRTLDSIRKTLNNLIRHTPLEDRVAFSINRLQKNFENAVAYGFDPEEITPKKSIVLHARTGRDFLVFDDLRNARLTTRDLHAIYAAPAYGIR